MQRRMFICTFVAALALMCAPAAHAKESAKDVTLQGEMVCGHCVLKETKSCQNVLKVTEGEKETFYFLAENEVSKANHSAICGGGAQATVTGTVKKQGKKFVMTAKEIAFAK